MEKKNPLASERASVSIGPDAKPSTLSGPDFQGKLKAYRIAKAALDAHCAVDTPADYEPYEAQTDALADAHAAAMDKLLLTPAADPRQLMHKLRIMSAEHIMDGWHQGQAIMAMASCDADRLLRCTS